MIAPDELARLITAELERALTPLRQQLGSLATAVARLDGKAAPGAALWLPNTAYNVGQRVRYAGREYRCTRPHVSSEGARGLFESPHCWRPTDEVA